MKIIIIMGPTPTKGVEGEAFGDWGMGGRMDRTHTRSGGDTLLLWHIVLKIPFRSISLDL